MTGGWCLPMQAELDGAAYAIRTDYRDILELLRWLGGTADPQLDQSGRWYVAMRLFYPTFAEMPQACWPQATDFLAQFLAAGRREQARPGPPLMDWQQDAPLIAAGISRAAGQDVRTLPHPPRGGRAAQPGQPRAGGRKAKAACPAAVTGQKRRETYANDSI